MNEKTHSLQSDLRSIARCISIAGPGVRHLNMSYVASMIDAAADQIDALETKLSHQDKEDRE